MNTLPIEKLPPLRDGTPAELAMLARQLNLPDLAGLARAVAAGYLKFADIPQADGLANVWVIVDPSGRVAQCWELAGQPLSDAEGDSCDHLTYGDSTWPVGAKVVIERPTVFVRGAIDILAAFHVEQLRDFTVVGMLEDVLISGDAVARFVGMHVALAELDPRSRWAFEQWRQQLAGAKLHTLKIAGPVVGHERQWWPGILEWAAADRGTELLGEQAEK